MNIMTRIGTLLLAAILTVSFSGIAAAYSGPGANRGGQTRERASERGSGVVERHGSGRDCNMLFNAHRSRGVWENYTYNIPKVKCSRIHSDY